MKGYFDDKTLEIYASMVMDKEGVDFSEGEDTYDFTRCMRSDGSYYGTSGRCRQGSPAGPKEEAEKTGRQRTPAGRSARSKDDDVSFPSNNKKPGLRDSTVAESRKAMRHHREQMNIHGNKIAELKDAGKEVPKSLQAKYDLAKASYNSHRKAINDATGVEKRPVMQEARERGRAAEKENQAKRSLQRGEESVAKAAARAKAKFNKEEMESPKNKADMDHAGLKKLMAKSPTAQRQLREAAAAKAEGKAKATPKGLTTTEASSRLAKKYEDVMKKVTGTTNPERLEKIKKIAKEMADEEVSRAKELGAL